MVIHGGTAAGRDTRVNWSTCPAARGNTRKSAWRNEAAHPVVLPEIGGCCFAGGCRSAAQTGAGGTSAAVCLRQQEQIPLPAMRN